MAAFSTKLHESFQQYISQTEERYNGKWSKNNLLTATGDIKETPTGQYKKQKEVK
jgi:hypothetical protein